MVATCVHMFVCIDGLLLLTSKNFFLCVVPVPNRPTTPLTAGALVPPPRPSSRPKLPTGKLTGINEIVSYYADMCNTTLIAVRTTFSECNVMLFDSLHSGTAI